MVPERLIMSKIPMGSFKGPKGDQGDVGPAGPNTVPTDQAIANAVQTEGSATKAALSGTYVTPATLADAIAGAAGRTPLARRRFEIGLATREVTPLFGVFVGSSTVEGIGATTALKRVSNILEKMLQSSFNPRGLAGGYTIRAYDASQWAATGTQAEVREGLGLRSRSLSAGATLVHTTLTPSTGIEILFAQGPGAGQFSVQVDSGTPTVVSPSTTGAARHDGVWKSPVLERANHTYKITAIGQATINAAYVFDQDNNVGFRLYNSGRGGVDIFDFQYNSDTLYQRIAQLRPIIIPILIGSNAWAGQTPLATYKGWYQSVINKVKAIYGENAMPWMPLIQMHRIDPDSLAIKFSEYGAVMKQLADENPAFASFHSLLEDFPQSQSTDYSDLIGTDNTHLTDLGHAYAAIKLAEKLALPSQSIGLATPPQPTAPFVPTVIAADTFSRADSASLGSTEVGAKPWITDATAVAIASNKLTATGGNNLAMVDLGVADYSVTLDVTMGNAGSNHGVTFLFGAINNRFVYYGNGSVMTLGKYHPVDTGGALQAVGATYAKPIAAGETHTYRVDVVGNKITCYIDGTLTHLYEMSSAEMSNYKAFTKAGLRGGTAVSADNFSASTVQVV
jgi:hypothetical protein